MGVYHSILFSLLLFNVHYAALDNADLNGIKPVDYLHCQHSELKSRDGCTSK